MTIPKTNTIKLPKLSSSCSKYSASDDFQKSACTEQKRIIKAKHKCRLCKINALYWQWLLTTCSQYLGLQVGRQWEESSASGCVRPEMHSGAQGHDPQRREETACWLGETGQRSRRVKHYILFDFVVTCKVFLDLHLPITQGTILEVAPFFHRQLNAIEEVQDAMNSHDAILKTLPLIERQGDVAREYLAFLTTMLFNACKSSQVNISLDRLNGIGKHQMIKPREKYLLKN